MLSLTITPNAQQMKGDHIPHEVVPGWFQEALSPLHLASLSLVEENERFGLVRRATYDHRIEVHADSDVLIKSWVKSVGDSSVICSQSIEQDGKIVALAEIVLVTIDVSTRQKRSISPAVREYLQGFCQK